MLQTPGITHAPSFSHSQKMDRYCGSPKFFPKSDVNNCGRMAEVRPRNFNNSETIPAAKPAGPFRRPMNKTLRKGFRLKKSRKFLIPS